MKTKATKKSLEQKVDDLTKENQEIKEVLSKILLKLEEMQKNTTINIYNNKNEQPQTFPWTPIGVPYVSPSIGEPLGPYFGTTSISTNDQNISAQFNV